MMNSNYIQRMAPERIAQKKSQLVHEEFLNHKDVLTTSFPLLTKLRIEMGQFSLTTANLFPKVSNLTIKAALSPNCADLLSEDQLKNLVKLKLEKLPLGADKVARLFKQMTTTVPQNLKKLSMHTDGLPPRFY